MESKLSFGWMISRAVLFVVVVVEYLKMLYKLVPNSNLPSHFSFYISYWTLLSNRADERKSMVSKLPEPGSWISLSGDMPLYFFVITVNWPRSVSAVTDGWLCRLDDWCLVFRALNGEQIWEGLKIHLSWFASKAALPSPLLNLIFLLIKHIPRSEPADFHACRQADLHISHTQQKTSGVHELFLRAKGDQLKFLKFTAI